MRKHRSNYRKLSKKVKRRIILGIIGALLLAFLIFWGLFYITDVEVVGNTRYTEEEVEDMALQGFFGHNSLLLSTFQSHIALNDIPFMESVDVEYLDRNSVRLHVNEKQPIGYVQKDGTDYYFDKDGLVLEALTSESASGGESGNAGTAADSSAFSSAFIRSGNAVSVRTGGYLCGQCGYRRYIRKCGRKYLRHFVRIGCRRSALGRSGDDREPGNGFGKRNVIRQRIPAGADGCAADHRAFL